MHVIPVGNTAGAKLSTGKCFDGVGFCKSSDIENSTCLLRCSGCPMSSRILATSCTAQMLAAQRPSQPDIQVSRVGGSACCEVQCQRSVWVPAFHASLSSEAGLLALRADMPGCGAVAGQQCRRASGATPAPTAATHWHCHKTCLLTEMLQGRCTCLRYCCSAAVSPSFWCDTSTHCCISSSRQSASSWNCPSLSAPRYASACEMA